MSSKIFTACVVVCQVQTWRVEIEVEAESDKEAKLLAGDLALDEVLGGTIEPVTNVEINVESIKVTG